MKRIAVYCGASSGNSPLYTKAAIELGKWVVANKFELVYGGGRYGLMGILAKTVRDNGGKLYGIIPETLYRRNIAFDRLTDLKIVRDMSERKKLMLEMADVSIALPGGPGTLEEISQAYSWSRIGENSSPCILYDVADYYAPLKNMFNSMVVNGFLSAKDQEKLLFSSSLDEITNFINAYIPPQIRSYAKNDSAK